MNKKDRLGNILGIASLWRCITFTSPLATPKGWRLPIDIAVYFYQNYGISMDDIAFERHNAGFNVFIKK